VNLQHLDCSYNSISSLKGLLNLKKLNGIYFYHNCFLSFKYLPENAFDVYYDVNPICDFYEQPVCHELSGTTKFLILREERNFNSYIGFITEENLFELHLFF